MLSSSNRKGRVLNRLGTIVTFINFFIFITSFLFFIWDSVSSYWWIPLVSSFLINYLVTVSLAINLIGSEQRSNLFIINYLFIFLMFPFIGVFLYFAFGFYSIHMDSSDEYEDVYYRYKKHEHALALNNKLVDDDFFAGDYRSFIYNKLKYQTPTYKNVSIDILSTPNDILSELNNLIVNAKRFIHMEFYLFCEGLIFEHFLNILSLKAKEGVSVRLIVDYIGNVGRLRRSSIRRLRAAGIEVRLFNPLFKRSSLWWQLRNHNKMVIVDGEYVLFGSCNIADEYFNITSKYFQTTELFTKLSGPIVNSFTSLFLSHWDLCNTKKKRDMHEFNEEESLSYFNHLDTSLDTGTVAQVLDNSPISNEIIIKDNLVQLIFDAKKRIIISTPYFFPPDELSNALKQASISGIEVKIIVPKTPDLVNFFSTLNRQTFSLLLDNNVEIYEYYGFNHEKVLIVDDEIVYFGSYNWDCRTLYMNFETAILVKCPNIVSIICKFMDQQIANSHQIFKSDLKNYKNFVYKCFSAFIRIFKVFL